MRRLIIYLVGTTSGVVLLSTLFLFWANAFSFVGIFDLLPEMWSNNKSIHRRPHHEHLAFQSPDGPVYVAQVVAGPFDLHRKYLSMEGPRTAWKCNVASLLLSKKIRLPESDVYYTENSGVTSMGGGQPARQPVHGLETTPLTQATVTPQRIRGLVRRSGHPRQLYWLKGIELTVIDENGKELPTAEFICHLNLDVDEKFRNQVFNYGSRCRGDRLISLTQGQSKFFFPDGYAVPMASDEPLRIYFQAANRTTTEHRRIKHLCRLYFLKDSDSTHNIQALQWACPFLALLLEKIRFAHFPRCDSGSCCVDYMPGSAAANSRGLSVYSDLAKRAKLSGHWSVPCGTHTFYSPYYAPSGADDFTYYPRTIHAVWCHVHPLCTEASLIERTGTQRRKLFTVHIKTRTKPGLEIVSIDNIYSEQGIPLAGVKNGKQYELEATYSNPTGAPVDSMVSLGIFATDENFKKPNWAVLGPVWKSLPL